MSLDTVEVAGSNPVSVHHNRLDLALRLYRRSTTGSTMQSRVLWRSHGHHITPARFGFIEALVRGVEQLCGG